MPCHICISVLLRHKLILYNLEDQKFLPISKHTDYYKTFLVFKTKDNCTVFYNNFENKGKWDSI